VTFGGGDPENQTILSIQALQEADLDSLEVTVVAGPSNPHFEALRSTTVDSKFPIRLISNAANMPELMAGADLAISAGGSTCWELAFMGLPFLVVILAENQRAIAEGLEEVGAAVNLGWYDRITPTQIAYKLSSLAKAADVRAKLSRRGRKLVDGKGIERVLRELLTYA
jgi:spore coat polysaccharide biosynthesis predicted glycosyltransferase SpsG